MILVDSLSPVSFLIDFGLAQQYHNPTTYQHTLYNPHDKVIGTLAFSAMTGVRPMIEEFPLEQAAAAYQRMMSGKATFRVVLTIST